MLAFLFSGPEDRSGGFREAAELIGRRLGVSVKVRYFDIINGDEQDLADDHIFSGLIRDIENGKIHGLLCSPPCSTFSRARRPGSGPRPLRGPVGRERYGLPGLRPEEKESLRLGTLLAIRSRDSCAAAHRRSVPWLNENPPEREGEVSLFALDEWVELTSAAGAHRNLLDQCKFEAGFKKATEFRGSLDLQCAHLTCDHLPQWWRTPPSGTWHWGAHPPLRGCIHSVPADSWKEEMRWQRAPPGAPFLTRSTAAYPRALNAFLAEALVPAALKFKTATSSPAALVPEKQKKKRSAQHASPELVKVGRWGNVLVLPTAKIESQELQKYVHTPQHLKGRPAAAPSVQEEKLAIGGLKETSHAVAKLPSSVAFGKQLRELFVKVLGKDKDLMQRCLAAVGSEEEHAGPSAKQLEKFRVELAQVLGTDCASPLDKNKYHCSICGQMLISWAKKAGDPDVEAATWTIKGAPAGITEHPGQPGVFPDKPNEQDYVEPDDMLFEDPEWRRSYESVEQDEHAWAEVQRLTGLGYLKQFDDLEKCKQEVGDVPVVSKFGMIIKERGGRIKRRLILDSKESGVTQCARKNQRILLPSVISLVFDILAIGGKARSPQSIELLVLDVTDAFWTLPLRPKERKYFVGKLRGLYFVYQQLAQGSRGAPLAWCRFFALVARLTQAVLAKDSSRMEVYVDDPALAICGTRAERDLEIAIVVLAWRALNLNLAFQKGQRGRVVEWIGCSLAVNALGVVASVKPETRDEILELITSLAKSNVVPVKTLKSLAGKLSNVARLLTAWRPFIGEIWGALSSDNKSNAPDGTVWRAQIDHSLAWFRAFLQGFENALVRPFTYAAFSTPASIVQITVDASPHGFGGVLEVQQEITEYFSEMISAEDVDLLGIEIGSPDHQQVLEALSALIALRLWRDMWREERAQLTARGDNMTMLVMLLHFKGSTNVLNLIARELALDVASACYKPIVVEHVPGVANKTADSLSRKFEVTPPSVASATRKWPPRRDRAWYRTLSQPIVAASPLAGGASLEAASQRFQ